MIKTLICGNYGATNLGDEAILDGVVEIFSSLGSNFEFAAIGPVAESIHEIHNIEACDLFPSGIRSFFRGIMNGSIWKTVDCVKSADLVVIGGGGLFTDEKLMAVIIWSIQVNLVQLLGKPYICIGQSVGPLRTSFGRFIAKRVFRSSHLNIVRDEYSAHLLNVIGIDGVVSLSDCAFKLHSPQSVEEIESPYIVMTIRPWFSENIEHYRDLAKFIDYIYRKYKLKTVLVPFQVMKDNDVVVLKKINDLVEIDESVVLMDYQNDYRAVMELIGKSKAVIGMRLHSLIFAALSRKPFVALSYSIKVDEFVEQMAMSDFLINWNDLTFVRLQSKFDVLMNKYLEVTETIEERSIIQRNKVSEYSRLIGEILNVRK